MPRVAKSPLPKRPAIVKRGSRLPYAIAYVGGVWPDRFELSQGEAQDLRKALRKEPSNALRNAYAIGLSSYVIAVEELAKVTPKKVHDRLQIVLVRGQSLREAIDGLETTDRMFIGSFFNRNFLKNQPCISQSEIQRALTLFLADVSDAEKSTGAMQRRGAMPAFPGRSLAQTIAHGLFLEHNKKPPLTRGGVFDRLLLCALDACDARLTRIGRKRRDVMKLMQDAMDGFDPDAARQFGKTLRELAATRPIT